MGKEHVPGTAFQRETAEWVRNKHVDTDVDVDVDMRGMKIPEREMEMEWGLVKGEIEREARAALL